MIGYGFCCCGCEVLGDFNDVDRASFESHYELQDNSAVPVWSNTDNTDVLAFHGNASFKIIYPPAKYADDNIYLRVKPAGEFTKVTYRLQFESETVEFVYEKVSDSLNANALWFVRQISARGCVLYDLDEICQNQLNATASNFGVYVIRYDNKAFLYDYKADYYSTGYYGAVDLDDSIKPDIFIEIEGTDYQLETPWVTMFKPDQWRNRDYSEQKRCDMLSSSYQQHECAAPGGYEYPIRQSDKQGCPYPDGTCESILYELSLPVVPPVKLLLDGFEDSGPGRGYPCESNPDTSTEGGGGVASEYYGTKYKYSDLNGKEVWAVSGFGCRIDFDYPPPYSKETRNSCLREAWESGFNHYGIDAGGSLAFDVGEIRAETLDTLYDEITYSCYDERPGLTLTQGPNNTVTVTVSFLGVTWGIDIPMDDNDNKISLADLHGKVLHCREAGSVFHQATITIAVEECPRVEASVNDCVCCAQPVDSIAMRLSIGKHLVVPRTRYEASFNEDIYSGPRERFTAPVDPISNDLTWHELDSVELILQRCNLLPTENDGRYVEPNDECDDCVREYYVSPVFTLAGLSGYVYKWRHASYFSDFVVRLIGTLPPDELTLPAGTYGDIVIAESTAPESPFDIANCNTLATSYPLKKIIPGRRSWNDQETIFSDSLCSGGDYFAYPNYFGRTATGGKASWYHKDLPSSIKNYVDNFTPVFSGGTQINRGYYLAIADIYLAIRAHVEVNYEQL